MSGFSAFCSVSPIILSGGSVRRRRFQGISTTNPLREFRVLPEMGRSFRAVR